MNSPASQFNILEKGDNFPLGNGYVRWFTESDLFNEIAYHRVPTPGHTPLGLARGTSRKHIQQTHLHRPSPQADPATKAP